MTRIALPLWLVTLALCAATPALEAYGRSRGFAGQFDASAAILLAMVAGFATVGALILAYRPGNAIGWVLSAAALGWAAQQLTGEYAYYALLTGVRLPGGIWAAWLSDVLWIASVPLMVVFLFLLFPDGRLPSPRWRVVAVVAVVGSCAAFLTGLVHPGALSISPRDRNPLGIAAAGALEPAYYAAFAVTMLCWPAAIVSLVVRWRRGSELVRQQIKWFACAAVLASVIWVPASALHGPAGVVATLLFAVGAIGVPTSIGIAIFRYRLYEIDVIVRRTLVYAILVVALALIYLGGVYLIGRALQAITGQSGALAVTLSTLTVAAAFQPLRRRIQRAVERRFHRGSYDAERTLSAFSERLRDQIDLATLRIEVLDVANATLQPRHASLWLRAAPPREGDG